MLRQFVGIMNILVFLLCGQNSHAQDPKAVEPSDWPQFRGPGGLGISDVKGLPDAWSAKQNLRWKTELPGAGASSPVVVGDRVFVTCYSGYGVPGQAKGDISQLKRHLICINAANGQIRWTKDVPATLPESESVREHGYAASTPSWDGERLYVFFGKSGVYAFDLDGKQLWKANVGDNHHGWGSAASPVVYKDLVIINACIESESLVALDKKTGQEKWRTKGIKESWNTPLVVTNKSGQSELVVAVAGKFSHSIQTLASRSGIVQLRLIGTWLQVWLHRMGSSTLWGAAAGSQLSLFARVVKTMLLKLIDFGPAPRVPTCLRRSSMVTTSTGCTTAWA